MNYESRVLAASTAALLTSNLTSVASVGVLNGDLFSGDVLMYGGVSVQLSGTWVGTVSFQGSNDGVTWASLVALPVGAIAATAVSTTTANGQWYIPITSRYFRARVTVYTSGTVLADIIAFEQQRDTGQTTGSFVVSSITSGVVTPAPGTSSGGFTSHQQWIAANTTNGTSVKASAGTIGTVVLSNTTGTAAYFKLYNKASAPTVGTDTPVATYMVPANQTVVIAPGMGHRLSTGIAFAITANAAVADTTAVAAGSILVGLSWV